MHKKQSISIFILSLVLGLTVSACGLHSDKNTGNTNNVSTLSTQQTESNTSESLTANEEKSEYTAQVFFDGEKVLRKEEFPNDARILYWYFDPACPGCIIVNNSTYSRLPEILEGEEKTIISYQALSVLGAGQANSYSNTAAAYILSVAKNDPEQFYPYLHNIMQLNFRDLHKDSLDERAFQVIYAGQSWAKIESELLQFKAEVLEANQNFQNSEIYQDTKASKGDVYIPLLYSDGQKAIQFAPEDDFAKVIADYLS